MSRRLAPRASKGHRRCLLVLGLIAAKGVAGNVEAMLAGRKDACLQVLHIVSLEFYLRVEGLTVTENDLRATDLLVVARNLQTRSEHETLVLTQTLAGQLEGG